MKKKIILFLCVFVSCFMLNLDTYNAKEYICKYKNDKVSAEFTIDDVEESASRVEIYAKIDGKDEETVNQSDLISNWKNEYLSFSGLEYFKKNLKCPPYLAVYDRKGAIRVYVGQNSRYLVEKVYKELKKESFLFFGGVQGTTGAVPLVETIIGGELHLCLQYNNKASCEANSGAGENRTHACVWTWIDEENKKGFCNVNNLTYLRCGDTYDIPKFLPWLTSFAITLLKTVTPIVLIVISILTLLKAVAAQKEDEIKKAQGALVKKILAAIMIFFVISIVQFVILKVGEDESGNITSCLKCFLNNKCEGDIYFKDGYGMCYNVENVSDSWNCEL